MDESIKDNNMDNNIENNITNIIKIRTEGKRLVFHNCKLLYASFKFIFNKKQSKLDINLWPLGEQNNRAFEAVKLLHFLFIKLDYVYENLSNSELIDKYIMVLNNVSRLITLSIRYIELNEAESLIFNNLLTYFAQIRDIIKIY